MDATKKPLLIPPEFSNYAEKHEIFQTVEVRTPFSFCKLDFMIWQSKDDFDKKTI